MTAFRATRVHDAAYVVAPGLETMRATLQGVAVEMLYPRGYERGARRQLQVIADGLRHFGEHYGPYPWPTLTVLLPPRGTGPAAAMEYPSFIVTDGPWWALPRDWPDPAHDLVAAHELAHQWFYGMLATNEVEEPFLDEGLAEWAALDLLQTRHERMGWGHAGRGPGLDVFDVAAHFLKGQPSPLTSSLRPAYQYNRHTLAAAVYVAPALALETVARRWGRSRLRRALGKYARENRFSHPDAAALYTALDDTYWPGFATGTLQAALSGERSRVVLERHEGAVWAARTGSLQIPLDVQVTDALGTRRMAWSGTDRALGPLNGAHRVVVDPERQLLLENRSSLRTGVDPGNATRRWPSHLVFWLQQLLLLVVGP